VGWDREGELLVLFFMTKGRVFERRSTVSLCNVFFVGMRGGVSLGDGRERPFSLELPRDLSILLCLVRCDAAPVQRRIAVRVGAHA